MLTTDKAALLGTVALKVADLENQISFYTTVLGFHLHWKTDTSAGLGAGAEDLVTFHLQSGGRRSGRTTGLYHFAVLFPNRKELARAVMRLFAYKYPNSPTDHVETKTTYLKDPEGQEIELYAESPEDGSLGFENGTFSARRADGTLTDGVATLDLEELMSHLNESDDITAPLPPGTRIGHVHLWMNDLAQARAFYRDVVGFDVMGFAPAMRACFVSTGGYHHHVGLNTWRGEGAPAAAPDALGLAYFTLRLNTADREALLARAQEAGVPQEPHEKGVLLFDPAHNGVLVSA